MADNVIPFPSRSAEKPDRSVVADPIAPADRPKTRHAIGDVLRTERHDQDRTLADVAEEAAVSLPYLSEVERGRKEVSSDVLEAVADALEISVADVLERAADRLRTGRSGSSGNGFNATLLAA